MRKPDRADGSVTTRRRGRTWPTPGPQQNRSRNRPTRNSGTRNASWLHGETSEPATNSESAAPSRQDLARIRWPAECITGPPPERASGSTAST